MPDYAERITVYAVDRIVELTFPSPYLRHQPTRLTLRRPGTNKALETSDYRISYEEAFREELRAFHRGRNRPGTGGDHAGAGPA